jgi:hypothetical protein
LLVGVIDGVMSVYLTAEDFFDRLVLAHPELANSFPIPGLNAEYGPIRPSYMEYLKTKQHLQLPEPELRRAGARVLNMLYLYAVIFTLFVLSALWWNYQRGS